MKFFTKIVESALLVTIPSLMAYPMGDFPTLVIQQPNYKPIQLPDLRTLSYDEVVDLLALIESDSFEDHCSMDDLDQINQFISLLAMEGVTEAEKIDMANATASLFRTNDVQYAVLTDSDYKYAAMPAIYIESAQELVLCRSWIKKQWDKTRQFVKEHKKEIIIGAIVVVTVAVVVVAAVVISSSAAGAVAAGGLASVGGAAAAPDSTSSYSESKQAPSNESFASSLQEQVSSFKETVAKEQFAALSESGGISMEENGRIVGSLFAHKTIDSMTTHFSQNELKDFGFNSQYPTPQWLQTYPETSSIAPHPSTDLAFSTDYTATYATHGRDLNMLSYQARGDWALSSKCYSQAVHDFGKAISLDPSNPMLYLERGIANFELGNYEHSIADYAQYIEKKGEPFSITDFSLGFARGVPRGVYESGEGTLLFLADFIAHPIQTSKQVVDSLNQLATLVKNDEFGAVAEALSPELHQLITQWDSLSSETRGELAGYAVGKLGADLMAPGVIAKVASKSVNSARELAAIGKNIRIAQETLILETASGIGVPAKISEIVEMGKKTTALGEDLGFTAREMAQLQQAGKLETTVSNACERLSPQIKESIEFFNRAENFLEKYKGFMPESKARELIHSTGVKTFPKPQGIPDHFRVKISDKGAGMKYVHPADEGTYVRVMPGKPHSRLPCQQNPYVSHLKNGKYLDKNGNIVGSKDLAAHIPLNEFVYGD